MEAVFNLLNLLMNKNIVLGILGAVVIIGGGIWVLSSVLSDNGSAASSSGFLTVEENYFDFGEISMAAGKVSHFFEVKNEGTEPLKIQKVYTSCMCTTASVIDSFGKKKGVFGMAGHTYSKANIEIGPGEVVKIEAIFDPAAHGPSGVGLAERSVYIETNSLKSPETELSFRAMVAK